MKSKITKSDNELNIRKLSDTPKESKKETVGEKFWESMLNPIVLVALITTVLGSTVIGIATSWVTSNIAEDELRFDVISKLIEFTERADFEEPANILKLNAFIQLIDDNKELKVEINKFSSIMQNYYNDELRLANDSINRLSNDLEVSNDIVNSFKLTLEEQEAKLIKLNKKKSKNREKIALLNKSMNETQAKLEAENKNGKKLRNDLDNMYTKYEKSRRELDNLSKLYNQQNVLLIESEQERKKIIDEFKNATGDHKNFIDSLSREMVDLKNRLARAQQNITNKNSIIRQHKSDLKSRSLEINELKTENEQLNKRLIAHNDTIR